jgi:hypothetical protein
MNKGITTSVVNRGDWIRSVSPGTRAAMASAIRAYISNTKNEISYAMNIPLNVQQELQRKGLRPLRNP